MTTPLMTPTLMIPTLRRFRATTNRGKAECGHHARRGRTALEHRRQAKPLGRIDEGQTRRHVAEPVYALEPLQRIAIVTATLFSAHCRTKSSARRSRASTV